MATEARRFHVGSLELVCLTDGGIALPPEALFPNVSQEQLTANQVINEQGLVPVGFNSLIVRSAGRLILVDTGLGNKPSNPFPAGGELYDNLRAAGLNPDEVDIVINTHGHPDHVGWNTRLADGQIVPTFPNATYYMTRTEWDWWQNDDNIKQIDESWVQHTVDSLRVLAGTGRVELADGETEITPEIRMMPSPGHTVGHASVLLSSGGQTAVFLGDLAHHPAHLTHPEWVTAFDVMPEMQRSSREKLFRMAYEQQALLIQVHNAWPGIAGRLLDRNGQTIYQAE